MPPQQQDKQPAEREKPGRDQLEAVIARHVLRAVGPPGNLHRVQVRLLWDDHYRVNIFVGGDAASATVAHSYFLVADAAGTIIASTPPIKRCHEPTADRA